MSIAHHEAGHVIVARRWMGERASSVTVIAEGEAKGHARINVTRDASRDSYSVRDWRRIKLGEAVLFLAGYAAEEVMGETTTMAKWIEMATDFDHAAVMQTVRPELPTDVAHGTSHDELGAFAAIYSAYPNARDALAHLVRLYRFTLAYLTHVRPALEALATELESKGVLMAEDIEGVLAPFEIRAGRG